MTPLNLTVGQVATRSLTITEDSVRTFAALTGVIFATESG